MSLQVLLSTYNGERYISAQIESLLLQSCSISSILIRDDGSNDGTVQKLELYQRKHPHIIHIIRGTNIGAKASFFELLQNADPECAFFAFCDQDDWWLEDKVKNSIHALKGVSDGDRPLLYFTPTILADSDLAPLKKWPHLSNVKPSFNNALVENIVVGATATFNKRAKDLLLLHTPDLRNIIMHDWWAYLCISAFGNVVFGDNAQILYRQHNDNLIGGDKTRVELIQKKIASYKINRVKKVLYNQALEFNKCYGGDLEVEHKEELELFLASRTSLRSRFLYLTKCKVFRQSFLNDCFMRFLVLIGYI
ncbi:hypothetical protein PSTEL_24505 [Paenibacillus stellifer]|uniref:Glycosyltransferase 2-like domain-containing protein n=1 Tax=Paenibacillus stellifer TaxID=169760 RepID=A0A089LXZ9_9BACL|nr:glycosyltransferase family 2 protein [Paenibacillus stellifer]AIQ65797.1 hypothetical protein PSTEL_24505 [Paenibacillus stellifer]